MNTTLINTEPAVKFSHNGIECLMYWNGGERCSYSFSVNGKELHKGDDFKPSPMHEPDSIEALVCLLGFMTVAPGDTDSEYFENHSPEFMEWLEGSKERDELNTMINDFENRDSEYHNEAVEYFETNCTTEF